MKPTTSGDDSQSTDLTQRIRCTNIIHTMFYWSLWLMMNSLGVLREKELIAEYDPPANSS